MSSTNRLVPSTIVAATLAVAVCGCPTSPKDARCVLVATPVGAASGQAVLPQLSTMAANPTNMPVRMTPDIQRPVKCTKGGKVNGRLDFDNPIDDLTAMVRGVGTSDGQSRRVCPPFPAERVNLEPPVSKERPCGEAACENRQVVFSNGQVETHVLFYDNPELHRLDRTAESPSGACYFRLHSISVAWVGEGPKK